MPEGKTIFEALQRFAESVAAKYNQLTLGEREDQIRAPFENFMTEVGQVLDLKLVCTGESKLPERPGRPDYAISLDKLLSGYVELKAPGIGANPSRFKGHNYEQWKRFQSIPNLLYSDGSEWALFRDGKLIDKVVRFSGDITSQGKKAVTPRDAAAIERLLRDFLSWKPIIPLIRKGKMERIDHRKFAQLLAPLCRMLRDDVIDALKDSHSPLVQLAKDWRQLLFPDASDEQFADAYAQTVTFALLLARSEGAEPLTVDQAEKTLAVEHALLSRALRVLTDLNGQADISASLNMLLRLVSEVPFASLTGEDDSWLYFYEDFLAAYDPKLRKNAGAYYTPVEVVRAQVRLIDDLLVNRLGKPLGFADPGVVTLDPAAGTGTYLLGVIEHALGRVEKEQGKGAVPGQATTLASNLYGFEIMVGPYAVTELRVSRALRDRGATLPKGGTHVYLTDTLENPNVEPPRLPYFLKPISEQHAKALDVKNNVPVIVCIGNPPYDRHEASQGDNKVRTGGWVRWGDDEKGKTAIFRDFLDPAVAAGHGVHVKNLYNLYVYFWRWALWKVFEHSTSGGLGIVSFISASSYLDGDAFSGMREHMRRECDEIWIIDLGGEGRGTRKSENVFAIQTPVAIAVAVSSGRNKTKPAKVYYSRIEGTRETKLATLGDIANFKSVKWQHCSNDWQAVFRPAGKGSYFEWPLLTDLMPWQHTGCEMKRTWPICHDPENLKIRWRTLLASKDRIGDFKETRDRKITSSCPPLFEENESTMPIKHLSVKSPVPKIARYAYRSFDRQWILADSRLGDYLRPILWETYGPKQIYLTSLFNHPLGDGPSLTSCSNVPDRHHLRGSYGGKDVLPLYRTSAATIPNILPGLLKLLSQQYKRKITPEDFVAYIYGALAQPAFTTRFARELETRELRVPITKRPALFEKVRGIGARLLWLHTYGERFVPKGMQHGHIPRGRAKCVKAIPDHKDGYPESFEYNEATQTLHVGNGEFKPVVPEVYGFSVSGLKVVQSWLRYRMKKGAGKKSSPLDDIRPERWTSQFTTELLELLWVLEATVEGYPEQEKLLDAVIKGPCFQADELPDVPNEARKPPSHAIENDQFKEWNHNGD